MEQGYLTQPLRIKDQPPTWFTEPRAVRADAMRLSDALHKGSDSMVGCAERKSMTESSIPSFVRNFTFLRITERFAGGDKNNLPNAAPYISLTGKKSLFLNVLTKTYYLRKGKERHRRESVVHVFG